MRPCKAGSAVYFSQQINLKPQGQTVSIPFRQSFPMAVILRENLIEMRMRFVRRTHKLFYIVHYI